MTTFENSGLLAVSVELYLCFRRNLAQIKTLSFSKHQNRLFIDTEDYISSQYSLNFNSMWTLQRVGRTCCF